MSYPVWPILAYPYPGGYGARPGERYPAGMRIPLIHGMDGGGGVPWRGETREVWGGFTGRVEPAPESRIGGVDHPAAAASSASSPEAPLDGNLSSLSYRSASKIRLSTFPA
ncbi:MAG: hypothetical protein QXR65_02860 [Candidatus Bathyarchaeia archaeon]